MIRKSVGIGCLILGVVLFYLGYENSRTVMDAMSRTFSGVSTAQTWAFYIAGAALIISGLGILMGRKRKRR